MSKQGDCTFLFLNFLIISLCNFSANSLLSKFPFLIPLPEADLSHVAKVYDRASEADFLSNNLLPIEARPIWHPSYFGFLLISNALSRNILSEAILPDKSLKNH